MFASLEFSGFEFDSLVAETGPDSLGSARSKDDDLPTVVKAGLKNRLDTGSKVSEGIWNMETPPSKARRSARRQMPPVSRHFRNRAVDRPLTKFVVFFYL